MITILPTGNEELDIKLGGGIPYPSLIIIEGSHGTGKSAIAQQILIGGLMRGLRGLAIVTESTVRGYIERSESAGLGLTGYFMSGLLDVYSTHFPGARWGRRSASRLLDMLGDFIAGEGRRYDVILIDSLSHVALYASPSRVLNFFNKARSVSDGGKLVIITLHDNVLREDLVIRARAICDGYFSLSTASIAGRNVKVLRIVKLKGAPTSFENTISFDVDPAFGIKLVPIALASV